MNDEPLILRIALAFTILAALCSAWVQGHC